MSHDNFFTSLLRHEKTGLAIGISLFILSVPMGFITLFYGNFGDEADKFAVGQLITQGTLLYRDIFSHHFPLTYYWSAMIIALFGNSLLALRISVLILQTIIFGIAMLLTRAYLAIGLTAFIWSIVKILYHGQQLLYNTFAALGLFLVMLIMVGLLTKTIQPSKSVWVTLFFATSLAFFSDPITAFALAIVFIVLLTSRKLLSGTFTTMFLIGSLVIMALLSLALLDGLDEFYNDAILFNLNVYSQYYNLSTNRITALGYVAQSFLQIAEPSTWMRPEAVNVGGIDSFDLWLLGGFAFRLGILLAVIQLLANRQYRAALAIYLFALALILRSEVSLRVVPFALMGFTLAVFTATLQLSPTPNFPKSIRSTSEYWVRIGSAGVAMILIATIIWRGTFLLISQQSNLGYDKHFSQYPALMEQINIWGCSQATQLMYYPSEPNVHFYSQLPPVGRYIFFYPWVADVGMDETVHALKNGQDELTLVIIDREGSVWGHPNAVYMKPLLDYLDANYVTVSSGVFRSTALESVCKEHDQ